MQGKLDRIKCFVLDMDGTVYLGNNLIEGSAEFLERLKKRGRDFLFLTNNSSRNSHYYADKLTRLGIKVTSDKVFTSGQATAIYLNSIKKAPVLYLVGTRYLKDDFVNAGCIVVEEDYAGKPDFIVLGFDTELTYEKLARACSFIRYGVPFIATHPDINCPTENGYIPDCGAMIELIKASTGAEPKIIGKPNKEIIQCIFNKTGLERDELAIIGDRLYTDITTGINAGILSILVLTGETMRSDVEKSPIKPDLIVGSIEELIQYI